MSGNAKKNRPVNAAPEEGMRFGSLDSGWSLAPL